MEKFTFFPYISIFLRKKKLLAVNFLLACVVAVVYSFFIAKVQFVSTVTFFPPMSDARGFSNFLSGFDLAAVFGSDIMPEQLLTISSSQSIRRKIIDTFDLYRKYKLEGKKGKFLLALKRLDKDIKLQTDEVGKMGISKIVSYTLETYHESPDTSYLMATYIFGLIDSVVKEVSTDRGRRDRIFIEKQMAQSKFSLDSLQGAFRQFQIVNKAYNVPEQINVALKSYGQIRASQITNEIQIQRLKNDYNSNYPGIESLEKTNLVLAQKLEALESMTEPDIMPGLELSTQLVPEYTNFLRDIQVQTELIMLLSEELEQAKLKEQRDVSPLKIIDAPYVPEYKSRPKRVVLTLAIVVFYMLFLCGLILLQQIFAQYIQGSTAYHEIISALRSRQ